MANPGARKWYIRLYTMYYSPIFAKAEISPGGLQSSLSLLMCIGGYSDPTFLVSGRLEKSTSSVTLPEVGSSTGAGLLGDADRR